VNVKLIVEYEGTGFHGWQRQAGETRTVEATLSDAIFGLTGERPVLTAAGRTDAGVHALGQCVNFILEKPFPLEELSGALNARLPDDLAVRSAEQVEDSFHARFSAASRTYSYRIRPSVRRPAYERQYAWGLASGLDLEAMKKAVGLLVGTHDFGAFGRSPRAGGHTVRTVFSAAVEQADADVVITVVANAFLYGMMRAISGALVEVGLGRKPVDWMTALLNRSDGTRVKPAPPQGLVQMGVQY
jgi:tRNA pseudouridine38-40 synthase